MNAPDRPFAPLDVAALAAHTRRSWDEQIVPQLVDYIAVPAKSPMFDPDWAGHGHIDRVVQQAADWVLTAASPA